MSNYHAQSRPAWQTDELEDEWIEQDEPSESALNPAVNISDVSFTQALGSLIITKDNSGSTSASSANTAGTFVVREDVPAAPILPKTPGRNKKGLVKDFFSPLPLERLFEPPSPPSPRVVSTAPVLSSAPAIPSRLSQVHLPDSESTTDYSEVGEDNSQRPEESGLEDDEHQQVVPGIPDAAPDYKFTFAPPSRSPFNPHGPIPNAQSTPGPSHPTSRTLHPPPTDPRLRLFQFNYDTFTRDHLSAMVDSIAVGTPSNGTGTPHTNSNGSPSEDESEHSISRLRSAKRIKLSPASDYSHIGDGTALIMRPNSSRKDYVGESKSLMEKIRQNQEFSTITTTTSAQPSPAAKKVEFPQLAFPHSPNNFLAPPSEGTVKEYRRDRSEDGTTSSKRSTYSSLAYREQAMNLMAQIRDDVKGSKRMFSADTEVSHMSPNEHGKREADSDSENMANDQSFSGDTEIIDPQDIPEDKYNSPVSSTGSYTRPIVSPKKVLRKLSAQHDAELSRQMSQISLDSEGLLEQFPDPPIQVLVTSASSPPSSPVTRVNPEQQGHVSHLAPPPAAQPVVVPPAYPSGSVRRNEDLTRFVSSSTASGTTLTAGSTASFVKHPGPKQLTHIAPSDIPTLPERVGRMVFDRTTMKWVKATSQNDDGEVGTQEAGSNDSEDPFRDIESLREDSDHDRAEYVDEHGANPDESEGDRSVTTEDLEKSRIEEIHSDGEVVDEEEAELTSFSFDGLSVEVVPTARSMHYDDLDDTDSDEEHEDQDTITSQHSDSLLLNSYSSEVADTAQEQEPTTQSTPEAALDDTPPNRLAPTASPGQITTPAGLSTPVPSRSIANAPTPILRSALKSSSITPVSVMRRTPANRTVAHRRSVSFSDGKREGPIVGVGRNAPSPSPEALSDSELEDENELDPAQPSGQSLVPSARSKRIAEMLVNLEDSAFVDDSPSKGSSDRPPTNELQPIKPRRPSSTVAVVGSPSQDISRRVFSKTESRASGQNATFLTECSFGVAHDRLVQVITDVQPFEPYWEQLASIDLSGKKLDSVARLKEFLPRLDSLLLNSNQLSYLSGVPGGVRTLSVAFNSLTAVTSFSHLLNLESLDISDNNIESLRQLECLRHLRELRADGNNVENIDGLQKMDGLVKLSLQRNKIRSVDFASCRWTRLEMLNLSQNRLSSVRKLSSLPALVALNLDDNILGELDPNGPMPRLRILRVSGNRLQQLNSSPFPNLRTLYADNNSLGSVIKANRLTKLENLSLRNQGGRAGLTLSMHDVRDVKRLYLSGNPLKTGFISEPCYNLIYLELAACRLTVLPQDFARMLPNLRVLNLNYNFLEETRALEGLTRLRKLTIIGSRINATKHLIRVLRGMRDVEMLDFRMNPCTLGWYLPLLVKDVPGALQPSDGDRHKSGTNPFSIGAPPKLDDDGTDDPPVGQQHSATRNGMKTRGNHQTVSQSSSTGHAAVGSSLSSTKGTSASDSHPDYYSKYKQSSTWKDLDSKFRRDLPDDAYVGRMVYRGLVMRSCPDIRMLDGLEVSDKERDKAERILKEVLGAAARDRDKEKGNDSRESRDSREKAQHKTRTAALALEGETRVVRRGK